MAAPNLTIAIDFDGVIHDYQNPVQGRRMGPPLPDAVNALERLHDSGYVIIICTVKARTPGGKEAVEDWLDYYGCDYDDVTAIKPNAIAYIDDRGIRHTDWDSTMAKLMTDAGVELDED